MNVHLSTVFMVFMTSAKEDTILNCGKHLLTVLTVFLLLQLLTKRSFVCMEVFHQSLAALTKLREL